MFPQTELVLLYLPDKLFIAPLTLPFSYDACRIFFFIQSSFSSTASPPCLCSLRECTRDYTHIAFIQGALSCLTGVGTIVLKGYV